MELVTVHTAFNPAEAQLVRSRLDAAGFHAIVAHEFSALGMEGYSMTDAGLRVQVPDNEAEEVREFLAAPSEPSGE